MLMECDIFVPSTGTFENFITIKLTIAVLAIYFHQILDFGARQRFDSKPFQSFEGSSEVKGRYFHVKSDDFGSRPKYDETVRDSLRPRRSEKDQNRTGMWYLNPLKSKHKLPLP